MAARWQQWMPFHIDKFKSSPGVRAMHPAARSGYLYLLAFAWQTDDCSIPSDPLELAEISELGDELWQTYGPRILRKFDPIEAPGRLRNDVCFEEWQRAKNIHESRQDAARKTTKERSPRQKPTVTVDKTDGDQPKDERPADTITGTVTLTTKPEEPIHTPIATAPARPSSAKRAKQRDKKLKKKTKSDLMDERYVSFKEAIRAYWDSKNPATAMLWGPMEGKQLGCWLREAPHITLPQFRDFLRGRYESDCNHAERPSQWIRWIASYAKPLNKYKTPKEVGGEQGSNQEGSGASKPSPARERVDGARRVLANIAVKRGFIPAVGGDGAVDPPLSQPGSGIEHRAVLQGLRAVGSQAFPAESREGNSGPSDQAGPVILPASR